MSVKRPHASPRQRSILLTVAAALAALSAVVIADGMLASQPGRAEVTRVQGPVPQLPLESWYFPAQYVNQATEIEEQPQAF